jgi:NAD+ synthase
MNINSELVENTLIGFIKDEITKFGFKKAVLGLSGGLDSTVAAYLTSKALGKENLIPLIIPYKNSDKKNIDDAIEVAKIISEKHYIINITEQIDIYFKNNPTNEKLFIGNKIARERMSVIFDYSAREKGMVIGTSNKTELLLGYGTWFGDLASSVNPLGDLYKTQVFQLAAHLKIPKQIIKKTPSADLWPGQTDEEEMGIMYKIADEILYLIIDKRKSVKDILEWGYDEDIVLKILKMVKNSQFKRTLPIIAKLSHRTIGKDFLYPRDWGV